ncbi:OmpA family protein [Tropicimonas sp. IMCC6043]|uniref:OmpA family protein n=1 Tax=Tropicimonas sp. IMCC6043 TaxID=2510645 RepID=UPI00101C602F|nr:OmpA family protein [Tropicimonas sp. IMCC6043]RYH11816.1 OmpA family protein [Tropicimonas sp. IMCC6043]
MSRRIILAALTVAFAAGLTAPTFAQDNDASQQSAEELQKLFEKQKTRGLVIAPAGGAGANAAAPAPEQLQQAAVYSETDADTEINVRISFDFDSALLREDQKPKLATLCEAMTNMEGQIFRIVGHTDAKGSEKYNQNLSVLRASEVKRYMVGTCGISEDRLIAIGVGEGHPVNDSDPNAEENRRVEFQLIS